MKEMPRNHGIRHSCDTYTSPEAAVHVRRGIRIFIGVFKANFWNVKKMWRTPINDEVCKSVYVCKTHTCQLYLKYKGCQEKIFLH